jgi:hypothetical protein
VSSRTAHEIAHASARRTVAARIRDDAAEEVALVAQAKRELLLRVHRHRLRRDDLEDCYSQAVLELVRHVRGGHRFSNRVHLAHALEQRLVSRIHDRRRALSGRSPMQAALETALSIGCADGEQFDLVDVRADLELLVLLRHELRRVRELFGALSTDQRLVLAAQLTGGDRDELCRREGWSKEKYRKVGQRARARLATLMAFDEVRVPPAANGRKGGQGPL